MLDDLPDDMRPDYERLYHPDEETARLIKAADNRAEALESYASNGSDVLPLLDGCGLVKEGMVVYFHPYTLSAGVYGQFNAVIPYHELGNSLKRR